MNPVFHDHSADAPPTEGVVISKIENTLDDVLEELHLPKNGNSVKYEKYIYLATDHFTQSDEYPLTMGWFRWGISSVAGPGGEDAGEPLHTDRSDSVGILETSPSEIREFLREGEHGMPLSEWWEEDLLDFVERFYTLHAPDEYRDIYLANIALLRLLDDIERSIHYNEEPVSDEEYHGVCSAVADLKRNALSVDRLEPNYGYLKEVGNLIEDVTMVLLELDTEEIDEIHRTAIDQLTTVYRDLVWLMIAHNMSINSAIGPNTSHIYARSSRKLRGLQDKFPEQFEQTKTVCSEADLLPNIEDYSEHEHSTEEFGEKVDKFMSVIDRRAD